MYIANNQIFTYMYMRPFLTFEFIYSFYFFAKQGSDRRVKPISVLLSQQCSAKPETLKFLIPHTY